MDNVLKRSVKKGTLGYHAVMIMLVCGTALVLSYPVSLIVKRPDHIYFSLMFIGSFVLAAAGFLISLRLKKLIGARHMFVKITAVCQAAASAAMAAMAFSGLI